MKMKKSILFVLSLALAAGAATCVSFVSAESPVEANATTTIDVYFSDVHHWTDTKTLYCYAWNSSENNGWPGQTVTEAFVNKSSQKVYKATIDSKYDHILFDCNLEGGDKWKTTDITSFSNNIGYYPNEGDQSWWVVNVGSWNVVPYTIHYDINSGDSGSMADQTAYADVNWGLRSNAYSKTNYNFKGWNTKADGSGDFYADGAIIPEDIFDTPDQTLNLYAQWEKPFENQEVKVSVAGGAYTAMTWSETNKQFELENLSLASGSSIEFKVDGVDISYTEGDSTNLRNHKVVRPGESLGIYIKYANGVYTVYVSGSDYETYSREVVINDVYMLATEKVTVSPDPYEYYVKDVSLNVGDTIKGSYKYGAAYNLDIEAYGAHENFEKDGSVLKCKTAGVYDIYLKSYDSGSNYNYVYIGFSDATRAISWATSFNTQVGGVCNRTTGQTDLNDLKAAWAAVKASYDADESIHRFFDGTESSSNPQIVQCLADYDYIVVKYAGETGLEGFISRTPVATPVIHNNFVDLPAESSIAIVAVIAVVAVTSIGAFFVIRKRKEN